MTGTRPGGEHILKVQGSAPKKTLDEESSKSPSVLKGMDVTMHLGKKKKKGREMKQQYSYGRIIGMLIVIC